MAKKAVKEAGERLSNASCSTHCELESLREWAVTKGARGRPPMVPKCAHLWIVHFHIARSRCVVSSN